MTYDAFSKLFSNIDDLNLDKEGSPADRNVRLGVLALLWEMASVDNTVEQSERERLRDIVKQEYHLVDEDIDESLEVSKVLVDKQSGVDRCLAEVKQHYNYIQRQKVAQLIWQIANANGRINHFERAFAIYIKDKLGLDTIE